MGRILTLRGVISRGNYDQIMMFDSSVTKKGWKVLSFQVQNQDTTKWDMMGVLHTSDRRYDFLDWDPNQVIAVADVSQMGVVNTLLDVNHVVVKNLYCSNASSAYEMNYLVLLEEISVSSDENIIYQLKERAQS